MDAERGSVYGVVALILLTTLASGPLVGAVDLTTAPDRPSFGDGNVTASDVSLPDGATLAAPRFGAGRYSLRVPPATMTLERVTGNPRIVYEIDIDGLGYSRSTTYAVDESYEGRFRAELERDTLRADQIRQSAYDARLSVEVWSNGTQRVLGSRSIRVEVRG